MGGVIPTQDNLQMTDAGLIGKSTPGVGLSGRMDAAAIRAFIGSLTQSQIEALIAGAIAALVDTSPSTLDTLNELAAALGDDPNFAATTAAAIAAKYTLPVSGIPKTDLSVGVQNSLGLADTALQPGSGGNSFATIQPAIGGTSGTAVVADSSSDTLTLDTGCGMTIVGDATSDKITLNAFGEEEPIAAFLGTIWETTPGIISIGATQLGLTANRKYLIPWKCTKRRTITQMQISVTSGDSGDLNTRVARLGIRNRNPVTGEPTSLVADCGAVNISSAGHKTLTGLSVTLDPGWYYLELVSNGAPAIRAVSSATLQSTNMGIDASGTSTLTFVSGLYRAFTYASLPADETGQAQANSLSAFGNLPIIMVR